MSAESVAFGELVRAAVNTTRLYCIRCQVEQAHERLDVPAQVTSVARTGEYWQCCRCKNVLIWSATP